MTQEEWLSMSEDWRKGYNAYEHPYTIVNWDGKSKQWKLGYKYASETVDVRARLESRGYPLVTTFFQKLV